MGVIRETADLAIQITCSHLPISLPTGVMMLRRSLALILLLVTVAACDAVDTMKDGYAHAQAVSSKLEKSLGTKSFVGFNWNNGSLTSVNVTFEGVPEKLNLTDIVDQSKQAIAAEFKQTPKQIVISFSVEP